MRPDRANPWSRLRLPAILLVGVSAAGVAGYMFLEGWSFIDSLYMTVLTLAAVGFTEVRPLDTSGKLFTIALILAGVTFLLITLSLVAVAISEGGLGRYRRRRMQHQIDRLRAHHIVCGYGRVGRIVARELEGGRRPFVVVDRDEDKEGRMMKDGVTYLIGDPTNEPTLLGVGVTRARSIISTVDSDADNVFIALLAKSLNPKVFVVARASEAAAAERMYRAGADRVISPHVSSGRHMAMLATKRNVVDYLEVQTRDAPLMRLEEVQVDLESNLVGRALSDMPGGSTPLVVRRSNGEVIVSPDPNVTLREGDLLVLLGASDALEPVEGE